MIGGPIEGCSFKDGLRHLNNREAPQAGCRPWVWMHYIHVLGKLLLLYVRIRTVCYTHLHLGITDVYRIVVYPKPGDMHARSRLYATFCGFTRHWHRQLGGSTRCNFTSLKLEQLEGRRCALLGMLGLNNRGM